MLASGSVQICSPGLCGQYNNGFTISIFNFGLTKQLPKSYNNFSIAKQPNLTSKTGGLPCRDTSPYKVTFL